MKIKAIVELEFEVEDLRVVLPLPEHVTLARPDGFPDPRPNLVGYRILDAECNHRYIQGMCIDCGSLS
jgi:hypothetical protein